MPLAHLYIFSDACPTDWLTPGKESDWHTIASFVVQTDEPPVPNVPHEVQLQRDKCYAGFVESLTDLLPGRLLRKWATGPGYRGSFTRAFVAVPQQFHPIVNAISYREGDLRTSERAILNAYNERIGGIEGRGIGFEEYFDRRGRRSLRHQFMNFHGLHTIEGPDSRILVLLLLSWRIADQYAHYHSDIVQSGKYGFTDLRVTVVSDRLSGDDEIRRTSEELLRNLIDPEQERSPIQITRSRESDKFSGDLFVDNCAGLLNAAMSAPGSETARRLYNTGELLSKGWHVFVADTQKLTLQTAFEVLDAAA